MAGKISIRIDADGNTHMEVNGCEGSTCETLTDAISRDLGTIENRTLKLEHGIQERPDYVSNLDGQE
jgi:hypothetical protein